MPVLIAQPPERAIDRTAQLIRRALDGLVHGRCVMRNGSGVATFQTSFHHATFVSLTALAAVVVAEVDFYPRYPFAKARQRPLHRAPNVACELLVAFDVVVSIDLDPQVSLRELCLLSTDILRPAPFASAFARRESPMLGRPSL